jgi:hypothetical protein
LLLLLLLLLPCPATAWLYNAPFAMGNVLRYVGEKYNRPETWITEFGTGVTGENTWTGNQVSTR